MGAIDVGKLTREEQLNLLDELWEKLSAEPESLPLTDAQREELDTRLDALERDGRPGVPWREVYDRLRGMPSDGDHRRAGSR